MKKGIAFFDFDGTLTSSDSFGLFAIHSVGRYKYYLSLFKAIPAILGWKLHMISNSKAKERVFTYLYKGKSRQWFENQGASFIPVIDRNLRKEGIRILEKHKNDSDEICIVTASMLPWVKPWAERHGITRVIATETEYDSTGNLTGRFSTPNCHGNEKVRRVKEAYPDLKLYRSFAYGDSKSDIPLINSVDHGRII